MYVVAVINDLEVSLGLREGGGGVTVSEMGGGGGDGS